MKQEIWKQVKGWEGEYEVSNRGNVKRVKDGKVLARHVNRRTGYESVSLYDKSAKTTVLKYVHRLVAETFIPNPKNLEQVDHQDGNKSNNKLSNLRWCSRKFNNSRKRTKLLKSQNHKSESHIHQFVRAELDGEVRYFKNANKAAKELGFSHVLAVKALRGELKSAKGWILSYIDRASEEGKAAGVDVSTKTSHKSENNKAMRLKHKQERIVLKQSMLMERMMDYYEAKASGKKPQMTPAQIRDKVNGDVKIVCQYTTRGKLVKEYKNIFTAQKETGLFGIYEAIHGLRNKPVGGYIWKFKYN